MIEAGRLQELTDEWVERECGLKHAYTGGAGDLRIAWLPVGTEFYIREYDGSESIVTKDDERFYVA